MSGKTDRVLPTTLSGLSALKADIEARALHRWHLRCLRVQFERTRNPVYAWEALHVTSWADCNPDDLCAIPEWVRAYLCSAAAGIYKAAYSCVDHVRTYPPEVRTALNIRPGPKRHATPEKAARQAVKALGFSRPGSSAFADFARHCNAIQLKWLQKDLRLDGKSSAEIVAIFRTATGTVDDRNIRRKMAVGRKP